MADVVDNVPAARLRVEFEYSRAGDAAIARKALDGNVLLDRINEREKRLNMLGMVPFLAFVWVGMYVVTKRHLGGDGMILPWLVTALIAAPVTMYARSVGRWNQFLGQVRALAACRTDTGSGLPMVVEVTAKGVRVEYSEQAGEFGWKYFDRVRVVEDFIALCYADSTNGIAIPLKAFATSADSDAFAAGVRSLLDASGFSMRDRAKQALTERDFSCPRCGYSLSGLIEPTCPECACEMSSLSLRVRQMLAMAWWKQLIEVWRGPRATSKLPPRK